MPEREGRASGSPFFFIKQRRPIGRCFVDASDDATFTTRERMFRLCGLGEQQHESALIGARSDDLSGPYVSAGSRGRGVQPDAVCVREVSMKTQGEIEAGICDGISRFEQEYMGRGPKDIRTHLIGDLLVVRLQGVLTAAEQQLVKSLPAEKGRDLLKQVRIHLIETARPVMEAMVQEVTGVQVMSLHHDVSTVTGEEVVIFTLREAPVFRGTKKY